MGVKEKEGKENIGNVKEPKQYKTEAFAAIHETMEALHTIGAIDKQTMREFDKSCLVPIAKILPQDIKKIREQENISQPIFAAYLNVSRNLISDWERGIKKPGGPALRLLSIIQKYGIHILGEHTH
jgi:putative transcriptional regulator